MVPTTQWNAVLDGLIGFRNDLASHHGFARRHELRASELASGGGAWHDLPKATARTRWGVYRAALLLLDELAPMVATLGVVVPDSTHPKLRAPAAEEAWEILLQRLERLCTRRDATLQLVVDRGNEATIRRLARRKRRYGPAPSAFGPGYLDRPFDRLVEDPWFRESSESYLAQWTDLVAWAAWRSVQSRADAPPNLWRNLGRSQLGEANELERERRGSSEPPGLIVWPGRLLPGRDRG